MRAYRAYKPPNAARSPLRAASTNEESPVVSGAGAVVTARQSLIVRRESTVVPAFDMPTPGIILVCRTQQSKEVLTMECMERVYVLRPVHKLFSSLNRVIASN